MLNSYSLAKAVSSEASDQQKFIIRHQSSLALVKAQAKAALLKISTKDLKDAERKSRTSPSSIRFVSPTSDGGQRSSKGSGSNSRGEYFFYSRPEKEVEDARRIGRHIRALKPLVGAQRLTGDANEIWGRAQEKTQVGQKIRHLGIVKENAQAQKIVKAGLEALENRMNGLLDSLKIVNHAANIDVLIDAQVEKAQEQLKHRRLSALRVMSKCLLKDTSHLGSHRNTSIVMPAGSSGLMSPASVSGSTGGGSCGLTTPPGLLFTPSSSEKPSSDHHHLVASPPIDTPQQSLGKSQLLNRSAMSVSDPPVPHPSLLDSDQRRAVFLFAILFFKIQMKELRSEGSVFVLMNTKETVPRNDVGQWLTALSKVISGLVVIPARFNYTELEFDVDLLSWVTLFVSCVPSVFPNGSKLRNKDVTLAVDAIMSSTPESQNMIGLQSVTDRTWKIVVVECLTPLQQLSPALRSISAFCTALLDLHNVPGIECNNQLASRSWMVCVSVNPLLSRACESSGISPSRSLHDHETHRRSHFVTDLYQRYRRLLSGHCCCAECWDPVQDASDVPVWELVVQRGLLLERLLQCGFTKHVDLATVEIPVAEPAAPSIFERSYAASMSVSHRIESPRPTELASIGPLRPTKKSLFNAIRNIFFSFDDDNDGVLSFFEVCKLLCCSSLDSARNSLTCSHVSETPTSASTDELDKLSHQLAIKHITRLMGFQDMSAPTASNDRSRVQFVNALEAVCHFLTVDCHPLGLCLTT